MTTFDYRYVEDLLLELLSLMSSIFTDAEIDEVQVFIDSGEYGLALDAFVDIVTEEKKPILFRAFALVLELAGAMQLDKKVFEAKLRGHLTEG